MKHYNRMTKKQKTVFHLLVIVILFLIAALADPEVDSVFQTLLFVIFMVLLIFEHIVFINYIRQRRKTKKQVELEKSKPQYLKFNQVVPYNHENWLRIFGYKREFKGVIGVNMELINNDSLEIDFNGSELLIYHNQILIGRMTDEDLIDHLKKYWNDDNFEIVPLLYDVSFKSRTARIQINFYKQIQLYDNPKIKVVESKLLNVDESQRYIEQLKNGSYLKVYRDEENANRFFVTNLNEKTLGDVKKEVAKLVDEYFDSGYVIVRLKEVLNEVDHTDALVEFFFIQRGI